MTSDTTKSTAAPRSARARTARTADKPGAIKALHLGSGDPLLLLHGFMLSPHCWERTADRLSSACEVYAPALPGHWGGPASEGWHTDVSTLADGIEAQLDELGWRTCHIAGNSLGAWVGVELARRGRARTLTLIAPAGGWNVPSITQFRVGLKFLSLVPLVRIGRRLGDFATDNFIPQRFALFLLSKQASAVPRREIANVLRAALNCSAMLPMIVGGLRAPALADLSDLPTPVRLLLAEYDRIIPNRVYARRYLKELPDSADRILVNGVGHVPMLEAPDRIATLIAEHVYASRTHLRAV
ncbi:alpha/beta fold hydrolase [Nocardia bhagyanarayanae]|uniref:Pimeloyl-ACP methyl ester carboxylesterase n=1 Tax=Nocardia bhagyanarayanae TaxID=1215925 RepID=A0A543F456_9NOCA|nr:alpha/beta fold hydrolase [Nocardia bhagyanarayanae]TQM28619.1 pimeloyl-ACP methyl ester carboxylesterase [Nocardia bhagyanarayanae]